MDWKKIVEGVAPTIATALGGPMVGRAVSFLAKEFLGDASAGEEQVAAAVVAATPAGLIRLKELDNSFALELEKIQLEHARIALENTASARQLFNVDKSPQTVLSYVVVGGFFLVLVGLIALFACAGNNLSKEANLLLGTLIGALGSYVSAVIKFWFGGKPGDEKNLERLYNSIPPAVTG